MSAATHIIPSDSTLTQSLGQRPPKIGSMLGRLRRRRANLEPTLGACLTVCLCHCAEPGSSAISR